MTKFLHSITILCLLLCSVTGMAMADADNIPVKNDESDESCDIYDGGEIAGPTIACGGEVFSLENVTLPSTNAAALEYVWLRTTDVVPDANTADVIPNSNSTQISASVTQNTWFRRCSRPASCGYTTYPGESEWVLVKAGEKPTVSITPSTTEEICIGDEVTLTVNAENTCSNISAVYKITDADAPASCFPTPGTGVVFQRGAGCAGSHTIWKAGNDLILKAYNDGTAHITGTITNNGQVGHMDIMLSDYASSGSTWNATCYKNGITGPESYYNKFHGTITIGGNEQTVISRNGKHFILANGASFDSAQFGLGAWTGGTFGGCTEWFGDLTDITSSYLTNSVSYLWSTGETAQTITVNPTETTTYSVNVTGCSGCSSTAQVTVNVENDTDGDGISDSCDTCEGSDDSADADGDGVPDGCDICATGDDATDSDADGVPDACDTCEGSDDSADADGDGVPDGCDICAAGDDNTDSDGDGVPDACDTCEGSDDSADADGDGVPDGCDICAAGDDNTDSDGDGVPDACDTCEGNDDSADADGDGVPDACDICAAGDDNTDSDGDGVPDACDICEGNDDTADADGDGVPDGCDICAAGDDNTDSDGDGVPDACDVCEGNDDTADADGDGVPDGCDVCANGDDTIDSDGDGVPDTCDVCEGNDDNADADGDGVPDGCDVCAAGDDNIDSDGDGVADACDICEGNDDNADADGDGVPDGCDVCAAGDDNMDADGDGVPDACDICEGNDDNADADGDGVPDGCDVCAAGDDNIDSDGDGVADACDLCEGNDDNADADGDGVPDGCDVCAAGDDNIDSDGDGVPDACDICEGNNDNADADGDGVPDGCDVCAAGDDNMDSDGDGVADACDACEGSDDSADADGDNVPDGCDVCADGDDNMDGDGDGVPDDCDICLAGDDSIDTDGDGVPNACDLCEGSDDSIDIDGNGIPDGCEPCEIEVSVEDVDACGHNIMVDLTAEVDNVKTCTITGCEYPTVPFQRCAGPGAGQGYEIWIDNGANFAFETSDSRFVVLDNGTARYTATASNGIDDIEIDVTFSGYTEQAPAGSPKANWCQGNDPSQWVYWENTSGTMVSRLHGTFSISRKGEAFQMGEGANIVAQGFGASGWLKFQGGDGTYKNGDININLGDCTPVTEEVGPTFVWTTNDGHIVGPNDQQTITVDARGSYTVTVVDCKGCTATQTARVYCNSVAKTPDNLIKKIYPIPFRATAEKLLLEIDTKNPILLDSKDEEENGPASAEPTHTVTVTVYDSNGRVAVPPRSYDVREGRDIISLEMARLSSGRYFLYINGLNWNESKQIIVE